MENRNGFVAIVVFVLLTCVCAQFSTSQINQYVKTSQSNIICFQYSQRRDSFASDLEYVLSNTLAYPQIQTAIDNWIRHGIMMAHRISELTSELFSLMQSKTAALRVRLL